MQLRESIDKTKIFFQDTLQDLKYLFHQNIPKLPSTSFNPLSYFRSNCKNPDDHNIADHEYYTTFCNELESDLQKVIKLNTTATASVGSWERMPRARGKAPSRTRTTNLGSMSLSIQDPPPTTTTTTTTTKVPAVRKETPPNREADDDQMKNTKRKKNKNQNKNKNKKNITTTGNEVSYYVLARKMKELEMMDVSDVEHVLDVEEALHYYSRLKSPAYLDIVDKFFTDMYQEISMIIPPPKPVSHQPSVSSVSSSRRRLSSFRL